ncbi:PREDICTED: collagen alpha-1(III) chain-like [Pseudopodoces humilis]|uniref:collagen alpha-1(III) chain-like n=1 Tax=Pseudopodoces humilis TaxID=181119 RepID=UPI0006B7CBFF|nr:PREDICTED: collagen alpha-1(III) chain-like [Pseudopodoces humilis]
MSPRSAWAAAARAGGSPVLPRGAGTRPAARGRQGGREGTPEAGRKGTPGKPRSLTHSHGRAASPPPHPPATSRREEPPALSATPPAGPPGQGGDPRGPAHTSQGHPIARGAGREGGENLVFDGSHGKGGRGAAPRRGEGDGKGELHHGPRGALHSRSPSTPRPPPELAAELGPGGRPPRPREEKMERGQGGGIRGRGAALLTPPQPPRLAGRRRVRSALPPLRARRGAAAAAAAANRRQPPPLPQLAPVPLPASKWRQLVSGCSNRTAEGSERGQRGAAAPPAGPRGQHPQPAARPERG